MIRDVRLKMVASLIEEGSLVLDLACGNGYLASFLPDNCDYFGVDRMSPTSTSRFREFFKLDLSEDSAFPAVRDRLPKRPDYISCVAFLEHMADPMLFLRRCSMILGNNGKIIGTTPHPRGRSVHDILAKFGLCSRSGANEHETFLDRPALENAASGSGGTLTAYKPFLFSLNQLFVIEYSTREETPGRR